MLKQTQSASNLNSQTNQDAAKINSVLVNPTNQLRKPSLWGVFLIAMSLIMLELMLTRIFSVTIYYHFAFMAVSLALLGLGASGVWVYIMPNWFSKARYTLQSPLAALLFAITSCAALIVYLNIPFEPTATWGGLLNTAVVYLALAIPFFFGGLCISLPLSHFPNQVGLIYFFDLLGASLGCLLILPALNLFGGPSGVLFVALLGGLAAFVMSFASPKPFLRILSGGGSLFFAGLLIFNLLSNVITVSYAKGLAEPKKYYEHWNTFSRITIVDPPKNTEPVWGLSNAYKGTFPPFYLMRIDAQAGTPIVKYSGNPTELEYLRWDVSTIVHSLIQNGKVLAIGAGGGKDILAALLFNQKEVTGVEINPDIINVVKNQYGTFTGNFYNDPRVKIEIEEGRTYLTQQNQKYDLIQASLIDSWAATSAGAFALTENSLYTKEAFKIYWNRLNEGGFVSMSRFYLDNRPDETMRLLTLGLESWKDQGVVDPRQNIVVALSDGVATVLFKKGPGFTKEEISIVEKRIKDNGFTLLYAPGSTPFGPNSGEAQPIQQLMENPDFTNFVKGYPLDISAPTDNRPFFFHTLRFEDSIRAMFGLPLPPEATKVHGKTPLTVLGALLIIVSVLAVLFLVVPLLIMRRKQVSGENLAKKPFKEILPFMVYFLLLGLGFLLVELPLIQRFSLFLGHPVYALAVTLFSILLFSSLGSFTTNKITSINARQRIIIAAICLSLIVPVYILLLPVLLETMTPLPILAKCIVTVLLLAPLALLMGMPFSLGIKLLGAERSWMVPWVWSINGAFSVLASVLSVVLAIYMGFSFALAVGALCYLSLLLLTFFSRSLKGVAQN